MLMDRETFAKILLSRFLVMESESQCDLIKMLFAADTEIGDADNHDESAEFHEFAMAIKELLFPESIGDVKFFNKEEPPDAC